MDNYYKMYKMLKEKNHKYPVKIYWILSEINAKILSLYINSTPLLNSKLKH